MALPTRLTELLGVEHPVMLAGMGGVSYHRLTAAVSEAGGFGCLGASVMGNEQMVAEIRQVREATARPFGVDLLTAMPGDLVAQVELLIEEGASLFVAGLGVPAEAVELCHAHGVRVANMCGKVAHARRAVDAGCDLVVAQGTEAGGHTGQVATMPLVPLIVDAVGDQVPVVAAGGIFDGRGLAAALALGADGVWLGTRFIATPEAQGVQGYKDALVDAEEDATVVSRAYSGKTMRVLRNRYTDDWDGRRDEIERFPMQAVRSIEAGAFHLGGDASTAGVDPEIECYPAGQGVGGIGRVEPAGDIVRGIVAEAEAVLGRIGAVPVGAMTRSSRALVLEEPRRLVPREFPLPDVGPDDGLLRVDACGLCGTDHEQYTGALPAGFAFVPGHESVGVVEAIGERAAARWGVSAGDRVAVEVFQSCGRCAECAAGRYRRCADHGMGDMYGFIDAGRAPGLWGGYAEHQYLAPDSMLLPVPDGLDPVVATLFNPLGAGIRWAVTVPDTRPGDVVVVLGPGVRGLSACVAAKEAGAGFVLVTGVGPRDDERLALAPSFGADLAVDVGTTDPVRALRDAVGRLADVVVDVTAKAPAALAQAVALARTGGTIVLAGTRGSPDTPGFWPDHVVYKELRILGALGVDAPAYRAALDLLASGRYPFAELPRACVGLDDAAHLVATMAGETDDLPPVHGVIRP